MLSALYRIGGARGMTRATLYIAMLSFAAALGEYLGSL